MKTFVFIRVDTGEKVEVAAETPSVALDRASAALFRQTRGEDPSYVAGVTMRVLEPRDLRDLDDVEISPAA